MVGNVCRWALARVRHHLCTGCGGGAPAGLSAEPARLHIAAPGGGRRTNPGRDHANRAPCPSRYQIAPAHS